MNRLYPAETRLKEGARRRSADCASYGGGTNRTLLRPNRWECSLAAGGWRPVSALPAVSRDSRFDVKRGAAQTFLVDAVTVQARNRAIANGAPLIAEIERYQARRGAYPESLFSVWGDYKPSVVGIDRYHYERSGEAYNVIFKEPSLGFGTRRFVVYNPRDRHRVTVHEQDRLLLDEAALDADNAGYTIVRSLPQPHWKVFLFLSCPGGHRLLTHDD